MTQISGLMFGLLALLIVGSGSTPRLAAELFKSMAGLDIRHIP